MRQDVLRTRANVAGLLLMAAVLLLWPAASFAAPTLGPDCGAGASIVGNDSAGRVTMGTGMGTCTLTFGSAAANAPACMAMNETNHGGQASPVGVRSTTTTLAFDSAQSIRDGDVVSYLCVSY